MMILMKQLEKKMADEMVKVKTRHLTGEALDWVIAKCEGWILFYEPDIDGIEQIGWHAHRNTDSDKWVSLAKLQFTKDAELAEHIIGRELIDTYCVERDGPVWEAELQTAPKERARGRGNSARSAAMRCYAVSQLGETVEVPVQLLESSNIPPAHLLQSAEYVKIAERAIAVENFSEAHGDPAKIAQLEAAAHAQHLEKMHARILYSVINNMGLAAPRPRTPQYVALSQKLVQAVTVASLERVTLFSLELRTALEEAYFQSENDSGSYDKSWKRNVAIQGKPAMADQSDEALLERVLLNVDGDYLRFMREIPNQHESVWLLDEDQEFIKVMGSNPAAIAVAMNLDFEDIKDLLGEISDELTQLGVTNPYAHLFTTPGDTPKP
jgi:Protein of unknown function (DUF2591)